MFNIELVSFPEAIKCSKQQTEEVSLILILLKVIVVCDLIPERLRKGQRLKDLQRYSQCM